MYTDAPREPGELTTASVSPAADACPASLRIARAGHLAYSVWWKARNDSSVVLWVARSVNDGAWSAPVVVDSTDHGVLGCGRPAASIAADSASGYVHVAWYSEPANGGGVFFAHSMDSAVTFHSPVPIVYGNNASRASVASQGDKVAVAYEDPNAGQPMIGISLSKTMGHMFEKRMQVTSSNGRARQPVVRIAGDSVRLWWSEYSPDPRVSATRPMYRAGKWN